MTTTAEHIAAIRKALEAGPTPGEWRVGYSASEIGCENQKIGGLAKLFDVRGWGYLTGNGHGALGMIREDAARMQDANAALVASCNPVAMTAVLAEIDRIKADNERMREALEFYDCHGPALCDCAEGQEDKDNVCCGFRARAALKGDSNGN